MDYKIKLEYSGLGKAATSARKQVLQAQKLTEKKGISPATGINATKQLTSSIQKLTTSTKDIRKRSKAALRVPKEKALQVPKEKALRVPKEKALRVPKEKALQVPKEKALQVPKEKALQVPKEKVPRVPKEKALQIPKEKVPRVPKEKALQIPKEKVLEVPKKVPQVPKEKVLGARKEGTSPIPERKISLDTNKQLVSSTDELIKSNKDLGKSIKKLSGKKLSGDGGGAAPDPGKIGAAIPILGAGVIAAGFALSKINQIGNAYIDLASQQLRSVGIGGFRKGTGIYGATEMGGGMAAFAKGTGQFSKSIGLKEKQIQNPLDIGTRYGLSAEETLGQAGTFRRAGGDIMQQAGAAAGGGIQADMPVLLSGMAGMLEDAIRNGVDATEMSKDLGQGLTALAMETPARSAAAALEIVRGIKGAKQGVAQGRMSGYENLEVAQASQSILMENLQQKGYIKKAADEGWITRGAQQKLSTMKKGAEFTDVQKTIGVVESQILLQKTAAETNEFKILSQIYKKAQKEFGTGTEGWQKYRTSLEQPLTGRKTSQSRAMWRLTAKGLPEAETVKGMQDIRRGARDVREADPGMAAKRLNQRQDLMLKYGDTFANAARKMESSLLTLVDKSVGPLINGLNSLVTTIEKVKQSLVNPYSGMTKEQFLQNKSFYNSEIYNTK